MKEQKETDSKVDNREETLYTEISRLVIRLSLQAVNTKDNDKLSMYAVAVGVLNHAQGLVGINNLRARRLLDQARRLINKRLK